MKAFSFSLKGMLALSALSFALANQSALAKDKVYEMDINNWTAATHHWNYNVWEPWKKLIEEKTDGQVKVNIHQGSSLGKSTSVYQDVRGGLYDVSILVPNYYYDTNFFPYTIGNLPFAVKDPNVAMDVLEEFAQKYAIPKLKDELHILKVMSTDSYDMFSTKPIKKVADLKNKKIRINGKSDRPFVKAIKGTAVSLPVEDTYEGLDKGMIDVAFYTPIGAVPLKYNEAAPYVAKLAIAATPLIPVMSNDFYDGLSEDLQQLFDDEFNPKLTELFSESYITLLEESHENLKKIAEKKGDFTEFDDDTMEEFRQKAKSSWDEWIKDADKKGYDGQQMVDDYFELLEKHGYDKPF